MAWLDDLVAFAQDRMTDRVREALYARGVSDEQIALYRIGHLQRTLPPLEGADDFLAWSGHGQKLNDVFVLPLTNALGAIKGVQFRYCDRDHAGYMDFMLDKSEPVLFGLAQAMPHVWDTGSIFLVEGVFDLFPVQRAFPGVVATLTARVTDEFTRFLRRCTSQIWLGYDNDETGRRATERFIKTRGSDFNVKPVLYPSVQMPNGKRTKDPCDLWETWGEARTQHFFRCTLDTP